VLGPILFNYFLDKALKTSPRLMQLIKEGKLLSFADDIMGVFETE